MAFFNTVTNPLPDRTTESTRALLSTHPASVALPVRSFYPNLTAPVLISPCPASLLQASWVLVSKMNEWFLFIDGFSDSHGCYDVPRTPGLHVTDRGRSDFCPLAFRLLWGTAAANSSSSHEQKRSYFLPSYFLHCSAELSEPWASVLPPGC